MKPVIGDVIKVEISPDGETSWQVLPGAGILIGGDANWQELLRQIFEPTEPARAALEKLGIEVLTTPPTQEQPPAAQSLSGS